MTIGDTLVSIDQNLVLVDTLLCVCTLLTHVQLLFHMDTIYLCIYFSEKLLEYETKVQCHYQKGKECHMILYTLGKCDLQIRGIYYTTVHGTGEMTSGILQFILSPHSSGCWKLGEANGGLLQWSGVLNRWPVQNG